MENSLLDPSLGEELSTLMSSLGSLDVIINPPGGVWLENSCWKKSRMIAQVFPLVWGAGDSRELTQGRGRIGSKRGAGRGRELNLGCGWS